MRLNAQRINLITPSGGIPEKEDNMEFVIYLKIYLYLKGNYIRDLSCQRRVPIAKCRYEVERDCSSNYEGSYNGTKYNLTCSSFLTPKRKHAISAIMFS